MTGVQTCALPILTNAFKELFLREELKKLKKKKRGKRSILGPRILNGITQEIVIYLKGSEHYV